MRICTPHCGVAPETISGGETYERELLTRLGRLGVQVELILARGKPYPQAVPNWTVHRFAIGRGLRWYVAPFVMPSAIRYVAKTVGFDLLRVHSLRYVGPAALWARSRYGLAVPVVGHHHHLDSDPFNVLVEKRVIAACDHIITVSEFSRRQLATQLGARIDHVTVVHNGVDERFKPAPRDPALVQRFCLGDAPTVLYLGGLKHRKNLPFLLNVWRELLCQIPAATLIIAGAGPLEASLKRRASELGIEAQTLFIGRVTEEEKPRIYNLADVFVSPSSLEGFGFSVAEAMSSGLPVVVQREGALPELVGEGPGGIVCEPGSVNEFVRALLVFISSRERRVFGGNANRTRVDSSFRWDRAVHAVSQVYEDAVRRWRTRRPVRIAGTDNRPEGP
jgi:glycosyltransferase involved in cell wall biosynthesis